MHSKLIIRMQSANRFNFDTDCHSCYNVAMYGAYFVSKITFNLTGKHHRNISLECKYWETLNAKFTTNFAMNVQPQELDETEKQGPGDGTYTEPDAM